MARYLLTGGSGFIGQSLCHRWLSQGHQITVFTRMPGKLQRLFPKNCETKALLAVSDWSEIAADAHFDAAINLAGEGIADKRWSALRKRDLVESRVHTTRDLVAVLKRLETPVPVLISGSATGYYGDKQDFDVTEETAPVKGFSWSLCERWEQMAMKARSDSTRVCLLRLGLVLGSNGGLMQKLKWPYLLGLGGPMGDGQHWFSWIHLDDVLNIIDFLIAQKKCHGPFNAVSPQPIRQKAFSRALAAAYGKKDPFKVPEWALRLVFGELAELLLSSQRAFPERLRGLGYEFRYPVIQEALSELLGHQESALGEKKPMA